MIMDVELRRGNWIITKTSYDTSTEIQVYAISEEGINAVNKIVTLGTGAKILLDTKATIPFEDLEGIELTREHLLAWGFQIPAWAKEPNIFEKGLDGITGELLPDGFYLIDFDYKKLKRMTDWIYRTGWKVANAPVRPAPEPGFKLER
jgi:hypothetical protein